jgi:hypothetical protein
MANELDKAAKEIADMPRRMVQAAAKELSPPILEVFRRDSGGDLKLSGLRNSGTFKVATRTTGSGGKAKATVSVGPKSMAGPAKWLTHGTRPRRQGRGRHPGTRGKDTFNRGVDAGLPAAERAMVEVFEKGL